MRSGTEVFGYLNNQEAFLLSGTSFGLIGFGALGRALLPLLRPFHGTVRIHDPWLPASLIRENTAIPCGLDELLRESRVIFVLAGVTQENQGFLDRSKLSLIRPDAVFVLMSRANVIDFDSLLDLVEQGRFRAATDVFPVEPIPPESRARRIDRLLLSPHRAGGIPSAYTAIGEAVADDLELILKGLAPQRTQSARPETVGRMRSSAVRRAIPGESR
ncbi:MAG: hypothetical protein KGP27_01730 [Hyphomicrobiales bacterium]|nr:hypothetical protein [Hyphomicrobiales bacterium]